ncbi:hypothetical protein BLNAU_2451 [Blattamonas nauphoetae]|uniref:TATA-binding protein interacting (TIP20) domain-containing protein n=1 Tax=Blattamonas nauphoetae TaxID=2049346 RepID=A0ABQ9YG04_9EUKA|nr:hypothetical protein BLNAU_2451 [Blattamonas nauphoetae]
MSASITLNVIISRLQDPDLMINLQGFMELKRFLTQTDLHIQDEENLIAVIMKKCIEPGEVQAIGLECLTILMEQGINERNYHPILKPFLDKLQLVNPDGRANGIEALRHLIASIPSNVARQVTSFMTEPILQATLSPQSQSTTLDLLSDYVHHFGAYLVAEHDTITTLLRDIIMKTTQSSTRKRANNTLSYLSQHLSDQSLQQLISTTIDSIRKAKASTPLFLSHLRLLSTISIRIGTRASTFVEDITTLYETILPILKDETEEEEQRASCLESLNHIVEVCLTADITSSFQRIFGICMTNISYDPYGIDDDQPSPKSARTLTDKELMVILDKGDDGDSSDFSDDLDDDSDDISWLVRKLALNCLCSLLKQFIAELDRNLVQILQVVTLRMKEESENGIVTIVDLLTLLIDPLRRALQAQDETIIRIASTLLTNIAIRLHTISAIPPRLSLLSLLLKFPATLLAQYTQSFLFLALSFLPPFEKQLQPRQYQSLIPQIHALTFSFISNLIDNPQTLEHISPFIDKLVTATKTAISDSPPLVVVEALSCLQCIILMLSNEQHTNELKGIFAFLMEQFTLVERESDIKNSIISTVAVFASHSLSLLPPSQSQSLITQLSEKVLDSSQKLATVDAIAMIIHSTSINSTGISCVISTPFKVDPPTSPSMQPELVHTLLKTLCVTLKQSDAILVEHTLCAIDACVLHHIKSIDESIFESVIIPAFTSQYNSILGNIPLHFFSTFTHLLTLKPKFKTKVFESISKHTYRLLTISTIPHLSVRELIVFFATLCSDSENKTQATVTFVDEVEQEIFRIVQESEADLSLVGLSNLAECLGMVVRLNQSATKARTISRVLETCQQYLAEYAGWLTSGGSADVIEKKRAPSNFTSPIRPTPTLKRTGDLTTPLVSRTRQRTPTSTKRQLMLLQSPSPSRLNMSRSPSNADSDSKSPLQITSQHDMTTILSLILISVIGDGEDFTQNKDGPTILSLLYTVLSDSQNEAILSAACRALGGFLGGDVVKNLVIWEKLLKDVGPGECEDKLKPFLPHHALRTELLLAALQNMLLQKIETPESIKCLEGTSVPLFTILFSIVQNPKNQDLFKMDAARRSVSESVGILVSIQPHTIIPLLKLKSQVDDPSTKIITLQSLVHPSLDGTSPISDELIADLPSFFALLSDTNEEVIRAALLLVKHIAANRKHDLKTLLQPIVPNLLSSLAPTSPSIPMDGQMYKKKEDRIVTLRRTAGFDAVLTILQQDPNALDAYSVINTLPSALDHHDDLLRSLASSLIVFYADNDPNRMYESIPKILDPIIRIVDKWMKDNTVHHSFGVSRSADIRPTLMAVIALKGLKGIENCFPFVEFFRMKIMSGLVKPIYDDMLDIRAGLI